MAGDKPISQLPENTSPNDNDFFYNSTPGTPRGDKFIRLSTLKEIFGYSKIHDQNTDLGTNSTDFTLGFGEDGTITLYFGEEGHAIRVNKESTPEVLEWTNDGVEWNTFGTGEGGSDPNAVQKSGFTPLTISGSVANLPLNDENKKFKSTLTGNFTYDHGTIVEGSNAIHYIYTGAVSTAITITFDSAYTNVDDEENPIATYELPAGAGEYYKVVFFVLPDNKIWVTIRGVEDEETGGGGGTWGSITGDITDQSDLQVALDEAEDNAKAYADGLVTGLENTANKGSANGYAPLDSGSKVPVANLPAMGASGGSHQAGLVPDPGSSAGTTKFLREDGTWQVPPTASSDTTKQDKAASATGTALTFTQDKVHGISTSETGNITFDFTNAVLGVEVLVIHNSGTAPTTPSQTKLIGGVYTTSVDNYMFFKYIDNNRVLLTIGKV